MSLCVLLFHCTVSGYTAIVLQSAVLAVCSLVVTLVHAAEEQLSALICSRRSRFYRAMHFSEKRGIAIACRPPVRLSVCDVGESGSHTLEISETNCTDK